MKIREILEQVCGCGKCDSVDEALAAIRKELEGCVPPEKDMSSYMSINLIYNPPPEDGETRQITHVNYDQRRGFNKCRDSVLESINKLFDSTPNTEGKGG